MSEKEVYREEASEVEVPEDTSEDSGAERNFTSIFDRLKDEDKKS